MRPDVELPRILATPPAERAATLVRFILTVWDDPVVQKRGMLLLRSASGQGLVSRLIRDFVVREIFARVAASIDADDAELRAQLVATQIVGLIVLRFGLRVEPLASADVEEIVRRVAPGLSVHLIGPAEA
nr:hypothetical protein [Lysinibacter cavernae]